MNPIFAKITFVNRFINRKFNRITCVNPFVYRKFDSTTEITIVKNTTYDPCRKGVSEEWNVPPDTVVSISVYPKKKLLIADLRLDKARYKRLGDPHVAGIVHYTNEDEGVRIDASVSEGENEEVNSMTYTPIPRDNYLRCSGSSVGSTTTDSF